MPAIGGTMGNNNESRTMQPLEMDDGSVFAHAVIVGGGEEIFFTSLSDTNTITGVMKRIRANEAH
jgi:hypothetical protein